MKQTEQGEAVKKTAKCSILTFLGGAIQCNHLIIPNGLPRPKGLTMTKSTFNSISRHCEDLTKESIVIKAKSLQIDSSVVSLPQNDKPKNDCTTRHAEFISASYKVGKRKISYATPQTLKQVQGDRYKAAFSLVEILVALIMVSLITAAIAPVITKKLSSAGITIAGGSAGSGETCAVCPDGYTLNADNKCISSSFEFDQSTVAWTKETKEDGSVKLTLTGGTTFTPQVNAEATVFLVGGGGGSGGSSTHCGAGGGGGYTATSEYSLRAGEAITIAIGAGGAKGSRGGTTKFGTITAGGGGGGQTNDQSSTGGDGTGKGGNFNHAGADGIQFDGVWYGGGGGGGATGWNPPGGKGGGGSGRQGQGIKGTNGLGGGGGGSCVYTNGVKGGSGAIVILIETEKNIKEPNYAACGGSGGGSAYKNDCADINCALCTSDKCVVCKNTYELQDDGTCKKEDALDVNSLVNHPYTTSCSSSFTDCALCSSSACVVCDDGHILSSGNCIDDPNLPIWNSTTCTDMHSKCVACTSEKCLACSKGYHVNKNGTCTADTHTVVTTCTNVDANCILCNKNTAGETCYQCSDGYILNNGACVEKFRTGYPEKDEDCYPYGAIYFPKKYNGDYGNSVCISKTNIAQIDNFSVGVPLSYIVNGDVVKSGNTVASGQAPYSLIVGQTATTADSSGSGDNPVSHEYAGGIYRPVGGYEISYNSCSQAKVDNAHDWSLMRNSILDGWTNYLKSSSNTAAEKTSLLNRIRRLYLCTETKKGDYANCNDTKLIYCKGMKNNKCYPYRYWAITGGDDMTPYLYTFNGDSGFTLTYSNADQTYAASARCILKTVPIR